MSKKQAPDADQAPEIKEAIVPEFSKSEPTVPPPAPHDDQKSAQAPPPTPTIGRIVRYCLSEQDAAAINAARKKAFADIQSKTSDKSARPAREGNQVKEGDFVAMIIVAVSGDTCVNGQLLLDGNDSHWVTSRSLGENPGPGLWNWPR